jgi:hypothetical protein
MQQPLLFGQQCEFCASLVEVQVHHVDWDHENNAPENRMLLCHFCHTAVHQIGAVEPEQLRSVRDLVELELRLFETGAPLQGLKERRTLIDAIVTPLGKHKFLPRSWEFVQKELSRIAAVRLEAAKG